MPPRSPPRDHGGERPRQDRENQYTRDRANRDSRDQGRRDSRDRGKRDSQDPRDRNRDSRDRGRRDSQDRGNQDLRDRNRDSRDRGRRDSHDRENRDSRDRGNRDSRDRGNRDTRDRANRDTHDSEEHAHRLHRLPPPDNSDTDSDDEQPSFWNKYKFQIIVIGGILLICMIGLGVFLGLKYARKPGSAGDDSSDDSAGRGSEGNDGDGGGDSEGDDGSEADYVTWCLEEHNKLRSLHGAKPLKLNKEMNKQAGKCAKYYLDEGKIDHSCPFKFISGDSGPKYGENLYMGEGSFVEGPLKVPTERAMAGWYREINWYDFAKGASKNGSQVGHATQLLWIEAVELGVNTKKVDKKAVTVCLYNPHGNVKDEYVENVKPLKKRRKREGNERI